MNKGSKIDELILFQIIFYVKLLGLLNDEIFFSQLQKAVIILKYWNNIIII
jgi:hypothetical protein